MCARLVGEWGEQAETCILLIWSLNERKGNDGRSMAAPSPAAPTGHCPAPQLKVGFLRTLTTQPCSQPSPRASCRRVSKTVLGLQLQHRVAWFVPRPGPRAGRGESQEAALVAGSLGRWAAKARPLSSAHLGLISAAPLRLTLLAFLGVLLCVPPQSFFVHLQPKTSIRPSLLSCAGEFNLN